MFDDNVVVLNNIMIIRINLDYEVLVFDFQVTSLELLRGGEAQATLKITAKITCRE